MKGIKYNAEIFLVLVAWRNGELKLAGGLPRISPAYLIVIQWGSIGREGGIASERGAVVVEIELFPPLCRRKLGLPVSRGADCTWIGVAI